MNAEEFLETLEMNRRQGKYWALRVIAQVNRAIGVLLILFGGYGLLRVILANWTDLFSSISLGFILCTLGGVAWYAGAELIYLLIDIEANTRSSAES